MLVLASAALAGAEEEIARIFAEPASIPGKLNFAAYSRLLLERGYGKPRESVNELRGQVGGYLGPILSEPCDVRRIRVSEDGASATAVVSLGGWLMRWFLVKDGERWWYADFEDVDRALRFTDWDHVPGWLRKAHDTDDEEEAVKLLRSPPEGKRTATIEAARLAHLAHCLWLTDREKEALRCCEEAEALCDAPVIELCRSRAAFAADDMELAAKSASAYLDRVGEDPEGCYQLGRALYWQKRRPEAVAAHLRGLKADPSDDDNLLGLFRALPDDGKAAASEHFLKFEPLPQWFAYIAWHLADDEEWASLEALLNAYRPGHEGDPEVAKYEAAMVAGRGRHAEAAPLLLALLPKCGEDRAHFACLYLLSMDELKKPLEGYEQLSPEDRDLAWSYLAELLVHGKDVSLLDALLAKRRDKPDASLAIWEIELRWMRNEYAEVDALFRKHADEIRECDNRESWRPVDREARSLLRLGRAADALPRAQEREDPVLLFAVHAALGQIDEAKRALEGGLGEDLEFKDVEQDEDAGPLLKGEAFADLRAKHAGKAR